MKNNLLKQSLALVMALVMCMTMAAFAFAEPAIADAAAPLKGIAVKDTANYSLAPVFQKNTHVYTVKGKEGAMPENLAAAEALLNITAEEGVTIDAKTFAPQSQLLTITTKKGSDSSVYYVAFSSIDETKSSNIADINVKKILEATDEAKIDSLVFEYELFPVKIVDNTAPVGTTTIPLAAPVTEDGVATNGLVTVKEVTEEGTEKKNSLMTFDGWENVTNLLTEAEATRIGRDDLKNKKVVDGTFSIEYDTVGQYVYLLHEVKGTATGVTYDDSWYEVTVSVVHLDPNDPESDVVVGWIEVKEVTKYVSNTEYTAGAKVNFSETTVVDGEKYDHETTSITYPFVNVLATEDLVIHKTVTGDLGDSGQEFLFKIEVNGTNLAAKYAISYVEGVTPNTDLTPGEINTNGTTGTAYFTIKHGETVTIAQLPVGATYTVTELAAAEDGAPTLDSVTEAANYNTTITYDKSIATEAANGVEVGDTISDIAVGKTVANQAIINTKTADINTVEVVNDKPLTPPTGTVVDMIPYIAIVVVAMAGMAVYFVIKKRKNAYEA